MAENPLLPNRKLQELYSLLEHCTTLDKPVGRGSARRANVRAGREAVLAAMSIHLEAGDLLSVGAGDVQAASLTPEPLRRLPGGPGAWPLPTDAPRLFLQAAAAAAQRSASDRVSVCLIETAVAEPGWADALTWAQRELLPVVFLCLDRSGARAMLPTRGRATARSVMAWNPVEQLTRKLQLPVVTADGQDAVAIFRVMQESVLRARMGGGPALIWALLPAASEITKPSLRPLARLRKYLSVRQIALPG